MEKVTLQTLNRGAVIDLFNVEFEKLLANINDENTSPTTSPYYIAQYHDQN